MWSLAGSQAAVQPVQLLCAWNARSCQDPAALGLSLSGGRDALGLNQAALGSKVLGLWVEQLTSAPDVLGGFRCGRPSGVSCMCPQFANRVCATRPQVSARAAYLALAVQGRRGEGRQGPAAAAESSLTSP